MRDFGGWNAGPSNMLVATARPGRGDSRHSRKQVTRKDTDSEQAQTHCANFIASFCGRVV